jgi:serine/threonine-protein kinase
VTGFTEQILAALAQLHAEGIVVQDLKPGNILMDERDRLVISDFGLAVAIGATTTVATTQSTNAPGGGTPAFMAPEQYDPDTFGKVSQKTDMWALGCVVIEMLTGFAPWRGKREREIMFQVTMKQQAPPVPAEAEVHGSVLAELLQTCLEHVQDARPTAMQALATMRQQTGAGVAEEGVPPARP